MSAKQYGPYRYTRDAQTSLRAIINSATTREEGSGELIVPHCAEGIGAMSGAGETRAWSQRPLQRSLLLLHEEIETRIKCKWKRVIS